MADKKVEYVVQQESSTGWYDLNVGIESTYISRLFENYKKQCPSHNFRIVKRTTKDEVIK